MGERIYTAEDAEALAAAATPGPWTSLPLYGVSFDATRGVVSLRVSEGDSDLMIAAHDLARSVAHHAGRAEALDAEVARLQSVIASVEMIAVPDGTGGEDHKCPFCGRVKWWIDSPERWRFHEAGCAWVAVQEVTRG